MKSRHFFTVMSLMLFCVVAMIGETAVADSQDASSATSADTARPSNSTLIAAGGFAFDFGGIQSPTTTTDPSGMSLAAFFGLHRDWGMPLLVGLDFTLSNWGADASDGLRIDAFSVLPTAYYQFPDLVLGLAHPIIGFSLGPSVSWMRYDKILGRPTTDTVWNIEVLIRPGLAFSLGRQIDFYLEGNFGMVGTQAILAPQARLVLPLQGGRNSQSQSFDSNSNS